MNQWDDSCESYLFELITDYPTTSHIHTHWYTCAHRESTLERSVVLVKFSLVESSWRQASGECYTNRAHLPLTYWKWTANWVCMCVFRKVYVFAWCKCESLQEQQVNQVAIIACTSTSSLSSYEFHYHPSLSLWFALKLLKWVARKREEERVSHPIRTVRLLVYV